MFKKLDLTGAHSRIELIALLASLMALNALALDIMLPALPDMANDLKLTFDNEQQWVLTIYMLGFGAAQMAFGPLSDRFGRRTPLIIGLLVYIVAAALAVYAPNFTILLVLRLIQGMGAASTRVISQAVTRDLFKGRAMAEIMSLVHMVFMIVPIIAPSLGQVILFSGPWSSLFWFMAGLGAIVLLWTYVRLPETLAPEGRRSLAISSIIDGFRIVFSNRIAMSYIFASTFLFSGLMAYVNISQQLYVDVYHLGALFPLAFAATAATMALASFLNSRVVGRFGMRRIAHTGILLYLASAIVMLILTMMGPIPLWLFFTLIGIPLFMIGWTVGNMISLAMTPLGSVAGSAAAVLGTTQTLIGTLLGIIVGQVFNGTLMPFAIGLVLFGTCSLLAALFAEKGRLFGVTHPD